jgi:uncharacterized protein YoxC
MAKLLKILVVLLLVASAAALAIEVILSSQREELKGRNLLFMRNAAQVAKTLEVIPSDTPVDLATRDLPRLQVGEESLKHFYQVGADGKVIKEGGKKKTDGPGTLDAILKDIAIRADLQAVRLNDTRVGLESTRTALGETSNTLAATTQDLTKTQETLKKTEADLESTKQTVAQKTEQLADLTQKNETLASDVDQKKDVIAKLTDKVTDTEAKIEATKRYVEKLQKDLEGCRAGRSEGQTPGLQGQIVVVNPQWRFVVIDVLPDASPVAYTDLTVQRNDKLVGKVRVSEVLRDRRFALADILPEWQQLPVAAGDYVFY